MKATGYFMKITQTRSKSEISQCRLANNMTYDGSVHFDNKRLVV